VLCRYLINIFSPGYRTCCTITTLTSSGFSSGWRYNETRTIYNPEDVAVLPRASRLRSTTLVPIQCDGASEGQSRPVGWTAKSTTGAEVTPSHNMQQRWVPSLTGALPGIPPSSIYIYIYPIISHKIQTQYMTSTTFFLYYASGIRKNIPLV